MRNFFLLNEAIAIEDYKVFIEGFSELNYIVQQENAKKDNFEKHSSIWELDIVINGLFSHQGQKEVAIIGFINQLNSSDIYISNANIFDIKYPNGKNGFLGIDFNKTSIDTERQVSDVKTYHAFCEKFDDTLSFCNVEEFWGLREKLFPRLVFCESVKNQITPFSTRDSRFQGIFQRLYALNEYTKKWNSGLFDSKNLGYNNSCDTPTRIKKTLKERTFDCPNIGKKVFDLHIKWSVGGEVFRLYFYPSTSDYKIYIGYIGDKQGIGF